MTATRFGNLGVSIETGHPLIDRSVDGFLRVGAVAATRQVGEDAFNIAKSGSVSRHNIEQSLKNMCKEGAYWGTVGGVYLGMEYGVGKVRGTRDWKNSMIAGALTGALVSAVNNGNGDRILKDSLTGGAVATASEFISSHVFT